jgi:spermidine synthase
VRIVRTHRGARIVSDDVVLSEILSEPGPTHTLFDVLAACVAALTPGPRFLMLGFAGGGMVAPLRAMGFAHAVEAVDLSREGETLFREVSGEWADPVHVSECDAVAKLHEEQPPWDLILEDLSTDSPAGTVKPYASFDVLPELIRDRLAPKGVALTNLLPLPGTSWQALQARVARPHRHSSVIHLDEYENRFVVAGEELPEAKALSRRIRDALRRIGSDQFRQLSVRTLRRH